MIRLYSDRKTRMFVKNSAKHNWKKSPDTCILHLHIITISKSYEINTKIIYYTNKEKPERDNITQLQMK